MNSLDLKKLIFVYLVIIFLTILARIYFEKWFFPPLVKTTNEVAYIIDKGMKVNEITSLLKKVGLIHFEEPFKLYLIISAIDKKIVPGTYISKTNITYKEIGDNLVKGPDLKDIWITIPEGYSLADIDAKLFSAGLIKSRHGFITFLKTLDPLQKLSYYSKEIGKIHFKSFEGFLFPDTYKFARGDSSEIILNKFVDNFFQKLNGNNIFNKAQKENLDIYNVLIVASILEREVKTYNEKRIAADIIWRRLNKKMKLQIDATLNYIMEEKKPALSQEDINLDSEYNTYKYYGLPPTPISNPGMESIEAAIFPQNNNYWYYLSDTVTGKTYFSKDLTEHNNLKYDILHF